MNSFSSFDEQESPGPTTESDLSTLIRVAYRGRYLIILATLVGLGFGYLNHVRTEPEYQSTGQLLVNSPQSAAIPVDGTMSMREVSEIDAHVAVLQSPMLIDRAIRDYDLANLPVAESTRDLRKMLLDDEILQIQPHNEYTETILDISFACADRKASAKVVNGLIAAFQDFYGEMEQSSGEKMLSLIREANDVLEKQLKDKQHTYDVFRQQSPLVDREGNALNLHQERMLGIETERAKLELELNSLNIDIQTVESAFREGKDLNAIRLILERLAGRNGGTRDNLGPSGISNAALHNQLVPKLVEYQALEEKYGPEHPDVQAMRRQLQLLRDLNPAMAGGKMDFEDFTRAELRTQLVALRSLRTSKLRELESLDLMFDEEQRDARALIGYQVKYAELKSELDRKQKLYDTVVSRLDEVTLTKDQGGYRIRVLEYAEPGKTISPGKLKQIASGGVAGFVLGCGLAYLMVLRDVRFTDIKQISRSLPVPIMGALPSFEEQITSMEVLDERVDPSIAAFHKPKSGIAEGYRGVRTGIYFAMNDDRRIFQVTSPLPGEGKSTLSANLAVSIAASGKSVLVIDADLRRPRQHKLFGLETDSPNGLASVIAGQSALEESIFETAVTNLSLLPCGRVPDNPGELLVSHRLDEVLKDVGKAYDFVLVDSPPMLAVSDPSTIAGKVEGVLMTFSLETSRHAVTRAYEMLVKVNAQVLGVVVNRVKGQKEDRYGMYEYGNAYYGYGYGYNYGEYHDGHSADVERPKVLNQNSASRT